MKAVRGGLHHRRDFCLEASCVFALWLSSSQHTVSILYPGIPFGLKHVGRNRDE